MGEPKSCLNHGDEVELLFPLVLSPLRAGGRRRWRIQVGDCRVRVILHLLQLVDRGLKCGLVAGRKGGLKLRTDFGKIGLLSLSERDQCILLRSGCVDLINDVLT